MFSAMLGSTVDTILAAVHGAFAAPRTWQSLVRRCMLLRSARKCGFFWEFTSGIVSACSAYWFDSGYMYDDSPRILLFALGTGVQVCGVSREISSGNVLVFSAVWFDSGYIFASAHEVMGDKGVDMPVVMQDSLFQTVQKPVRLQRSSGDAPVVVLRQVSTLTVELFHLQFIARVWRTSFAV